MMIRSPSYRAGTVLSKYDIIIINCGESDSYRNSRLISADFLMTASTMLKDGGLIFLPTLYDSDRHISPIRGKFWQLSTIPSRRLSAILMYGPVR